MYEQLTTLISRYPALSACQEEILAAFELLKTSYASGHKLLVAGNGGSAADAEHISGELMKSFLKKRSIDATVQSFLSNKYGEDGTMLASQLEGALPVIPLSSLTSLYTAFSNDVDSNAAFAQMVYGYGNMGDVLLAISTSGNSRNIINATMVARAKGMKTIGLTGDSGGKLNDYCDIVIHAPGNETYIIQEYHLPIYHTLCAMLEVEFFNDR